MATTISDAFTTLTFLLNYKSRSIRLILVTSFFLAFNLTTFMVL